MSEPARRPDGIAGSALPGPVPGRRVRRAAAASPARALARVQLFGEVWNLRRARATVVLRAARRARARCRARCGAATSTQLGLPRRLADGAQVVVAGGCDYYPGSATVLAVVLVRASTDLRVAGEGDLLAQLERLRQPLDAEGLFEPQKRAAAARCCRARSASSPARAARRATTCSPACARRGWGGRLVWALRAGAGPPRRAARSRGAARPRRDRARSSRSIVARGGGSLADLFAFCDETLCRTVALLRVPVIASRRPPHRPHADRRRRRRQLLDADARRRGRRAARLPRRARATLLREARRARRATAAAPCSSARARSPRWRARPASTSRATAAQLHQQLRELRASAAAARARASASATAHARARAAAQGAASARPPRPHAAPPRRSTRLALALAAHDPRARARARLRARRGPRRRARHDRAARARAARRACALRFADGARRRDDRGSSDDERVDADAERHLRGRRRARLEEIIRRLDSGEAGLRETLELVKEGRGAGRVLRRRARRRQQGPRGAAARRARRAARAQARGSRPPSERAARR